MISGICFVSWNCKDLKALEEQTSGDERVQRVQVRKSEHLIPPGIDLVRGTEPHQCQIHIDRTLTDIFFSNSKQVFGDSHRV